MLPGGSTRTAGGTVTVTRQRRCRLVNRSSIVIGDDSAALTASVLGVRLGLIGAVILGVFDAAEFKTGTVRTTFTAARTIGQGPRREGDRADRGRLARWR